MFFAFIHLAGVFAYNTTGDIYALYPSIALLCVSILIHVLGFSAVMSNTFAAEISASAKQSKIDFSSTLIRHLSSFVAAWTLYQAGWTLLAGMCFLHISTIMMSLFYSKLFNEGYT